MALPGTTVTVRDTAPAREAPTDTSVAFVLGHTEKGPLTPVKVVSMSDYAAILGARVSYGWLYDWLDVFFREGGQAAYIGRVVGGASQVASVSLLDSGAAATLTVAAKSPGVWGNSLNVAVTVTGSQFQLVVTDDVLGALETSPLLDDGAAAVVWAASSQYITVTDTGGAGDPVAVAAQSLTGGTDDHAAATDANWKTSLDRFTADLGPGQVVAPGRSTAQTYTDLLAHASANNRGAILDAPDTPTESTLASLAVAQRTNGEFGGLFAPWDVAPGITAGTTRPVPPSARVCGNIARTDRGADTNQPSAGEEWGEAVYIVGLTQPAWSDADRKLLNEAGVNVSRVIYGGVRTYGWRTLADPVVHPDRLMLSNSRLLMQIRNELQIAGESFMFAEIDGQGRTLARFAGRLTAPLTDHFVAGSLFGATPEEAFFVDVGPNVNTLTTLANRELHAVCQVRLSPFGETVAIEIVKRLVTESIT